MSNLPEPQFPLAVKRYAMPGSHARRLELSEQAWESWAWGRGREEDRNCCEGARRSRATCPGGANGGNRRVGRG